MATYELKFDLLHFFSLQNDNKTLAVYVTGDEAQIDKRWKEDETFSLGWFRKPMSDYTLSDDGISGTTYGWADSPVTSIRTHQEGGSDNQPYHYYNDFTVGSNGNDNYRICLYFGLDNNNIPSLRVLVYNVETGTYPYNGSNTYFNSPQKSEGCLFWSMGSGYLGGLTLNSTLTEGIHFPTSYGTTYACVCELCTNIPVFDTYAHAQAYCETLSTEGLLNTISDPAEEYEDARKYNYIWNIYGHNANNATQYTGYRNYRFYGGNGKICLYRVRATEGSPYTVKLANYSTYTVKAAGVHDTDDEDYETISNPELYFLNESIQFSSSNYYKVFKWSTDLLIFGSLAEAEMWERDEIDARQAENFNLVSRAYDLIVDPGYGNPDAGYDNGLNGQSYVHGARMWVMTSSQLNNFFDDIFDPVNIQNILDGTKLFGSNEIQAIQGITYFPLDLDDVATVYSSAQAIKIGSFTCPTATGRYVQNNNKLLNCGRVFISPVYNDFRDYRIKLFISLPYCGVHELNISKFLHHYLEVYYAVDITTGACSAHVLADGISYGDTFDGFMASQRPVTALDQTAYLSSVMSSVSSIVHREAGMISDAKSAIAGVATGNTKGATSGPSGLDISSGAISDLYNLSQAVKDVPMTSRGGFAGCLGFFGNQHIHIITVQSKTVKPSLEQQIVGYPSHVSQRIGNFSGFLKTSAINLNNFSGTAQELEDIHNALAKGIYI